MISEKELAAVEGSRKYYDDNVTDNLFESVDYVINGAPISEALYDAAIRKPLLENLELNSEHRVLDVGCGNGLILSEVEKICTNSIGVDISQKLIDSYSGMAKVMVCAAHELPFEDASFDRIYMQSVVIHFPSMDYFKQVINKCIALLDTNGILVIGDVVVGGYKGKTKYFFLDLHELVDYLASLGLPYSLLAQNKEKRSFSNRSDIIIYKDSEK